jgi:hypothetical protein
MRYNPTGPTDEMKRRLLNAITAVSLLLCVAVCALWVRSYASDDQHLLWKPALPASRSRSSYLECRAVKGQLWAYGYRVPLDPPPPDPHRPAVWLWGTEARDSKWSFFRLGLPALTVRAGFGWDRGPIHLQSPADGREYIGLTWLMCVPLWSVALVLSLPPITGAVASARRRRHHRRAAAGLCQRCGYDLRATPGRCPECGTDAVR